MMKVVPKAVEIVVEVVPKVVEVVLKATFVPQGSLGKPRAAAGVQTWKHGVWRLHGALVTRFSRADVDGSSSGALEARCRFNDVEA